MGSLRIALVLSLIFGLSSRIVSCSTLPSPRVKRYAFPKEAYLKKPKRPYEVVGTVRAKALYNSLNPDFDETFLCKNFFNRAVQDLIRFGKDQDADAVI